MLTTSKRWLYGVVTLLGKRWVLGALLALTLTVGLMAQQPVNVINSTISVLQSVANWTINLVQVNGTTIDSNSGAKSAGTVRMVLATDQPQLTNKLLVTPDSVALPANQSVNVSQINAVTPLMGNGVTGTGSQRVTIASDNTAFAVNNTQQGTAANNITQFGGVNLSTGTGVGGTGIPRVTLSSDSSLASNQSTNVAQFAGAAAVTGTGASGAGVPRFTIANDSALAANQSVNLNQVGGVGVVLGKTYATASIPTVSAIDDPVVIALGLISNALRSAGKGGFLGSFGRPITSTGDALDVNVKYPATVADACMGAKQNAAISQTTNTLLANGQSGRRLVVCAITLVGADAENISLVEGTGAACATGTAGVIGGATAATGTNLAANGGFAIGTGAGTIAAQRTPGNDLCLYQSGSGRVAGNLVYAIQQ